MDPLTSLGLVASLVQLVDFSGKIVSCSTQLYESSTGALADNVAIKAVLDHLILLNDKVKKSGTSTGDPVLENLCKSCSVVAVELLTTLEKIQVQGHRQKLESVRKAFQSVWSKKRIEELERRLAGFRQQLNLHLAVDIRSVFFP
jgi:hypothetical protein